ncbi:MAG: hypothetical protein MUO70_08800 [Euryarchaeota archaeon]|nr:hypothetical protein [Euryarchaeota archaeon]
MDNDVIHLVDKLKTGAVDRCRERVLRAAEKTKNGEQKQNFVKRPPPGGIASHLKERRGL